MDRPLMPTKLRASLRAATGLRALWLYTVAATLYWTPSQWRHFQAERQFVEALHAQGQGEAAEAVMRITEASERDADNAYGLGIAAVLCERRLESKFDVMSFFGGTFVASGRQRGHLLDGIAYCRRALQLSPGDSGFLNNLGWLHAMCGEWGTAADYIRQAVDLGDNVALNYISLGLLEERHGSLQGALDAYSAALVVEPGIVDSEFFHDFSGRNPRGANEAVRLAVAKLKNDASRDFVISAAKLGKLFLQQGNIEDAARSLQEALHALPNLPRAWMNLGAAKRRQGDVEGAELCLRRAVFLGPDDSTAWLSLAELREEAGATGEASFLYERAFQRWMRPASVHSQRASRMYGASHPLLDDVIPDGFLQYCTGGFAAAEAFGIAKAPQSNAPEDAR